MKDRDVKVVINNYKYRESDKRSILPDNKFVIVLLAFLIVIAVVLLVVYIITNHEEEEIIIEKPIEVVEPDISESDINILLKKYALLDNCSHNIIESFIMNNRPIDITTNTDESVANMYTSIVLNTFYMYKEEVSLNDVKEKAKLMFDIPDSYQLGKNTWVRDYEGETGCSAFTYDSSTSSYVKDTSEERDASTNYCVNTCSYYGSEPYVRLDDYELVDDILSLYYKAIYVGLDGEELVIYSDINKTQKIGTAFSINDIKDEDFEKGMDITLTFKKVGDDYKFVKSEFE